MDNLSTTLRGLPAHRPNGREDIRRRYSSMRPTWSPRAVSSARGPPKKPPRQLAASPLLFIQVTSAPPQCSRGGQGHGTRQATTSLLIYFCRSSFGVRTVDFKCVELFWNWNDTSFVVNKPHGKATTEQLPTVWMERLLRGREVRLSSATVSSVGANRGC